jgi:uncharacterized membrane protein YdcZ (DUF606 family)
MQSVFGASWMTTAVGYAVMVLTVAQQVFVEHGFPETTDGWFKFVGGIVTGMGIALAKDFNKSNSAHPQPMAQVVNPVVTDKPNG